ncbi:MAG: hypothetical protein MJZ78_07775 [Bacteroidales bacterium]|nr:hypothetical protein [Bacteroidales bacterium]
MSEQEVINYQSIKEFLSKKGTSVPTSLNTEVVVSMPGKPSFDRHVDVLFSEDTSAIKVFINDLTPTPFYTEYSTMYQKFMYNEGVDSLIITDNHETYKVIIK